MKIEFNTREFIYEHGNAPKGYGSWCFTFEGFDLWVHGAKYSEAKKKVREHIKQIAPKGYTETVYVNVEP